MVAHPSCWGLQDHLEFSYDGTIHACCYGYPKLRQDGGWNEAGHVYLCDVADDKFPHEAIREARAKLHAQIAALNPEATVCIECPVLKMAEWGARQYLVRYISLNTWLLQSEMLLLLRGGPGVRGQADLV